MKDSLSALGDACIPDIFKSLIVQQELYLKVRTENLNIP